MSYKRFCITLEEEINGRLTKWMADHKVKNRSKAVAFLLNHSLDKALWGKDKSKGHMITTLFYDRSNRDISRRLKDIQYEHWNTIQDVFHVHMGGCRFMEVVILYGSKQKLMKISQTLLALKGVVSGGTCWTQPDFEELSEEEET